MNLSFRTVRTLPAGPLPPHFALHHVARSSALDPRPAQWVRRRLAMKYPAKLRWILERSRFVGCQATKECLRPFPQHNAISRLASSRPFAPQPEHRRRLAPGPPFPHSNRGIPRRQARPRPAAPYVTLQGLANPQRHFPPSWTGGWLPQNNAQKQPAFPGVKQAISRSGALHFEAAESR